MPGLVPGIHLFGPLFRYPQAPSSINTHPTALAPCSDQVTAHTSQLSCLRHRDNAASNQTEHRALRLGMG